MYLCAQRCVALTETNLRAPPGSARTIQVVPTVFFCPPASPPALQKENRFTTCLLGRPVLVSPPDVLDTESARGHPRPVLYHLWTLVASRSSFIEEVPVPTAALPHGPQVPRRDPHLGRRLCRFYPLLDEVICPTVAPPPSWSSRTRAVDRTETGLLQPESFHGASTLASSVLARRRIGS